MTVRTLKRCTTAFLVLGLLILPQCGWLGTVTITPQSGASVLSGNNSPGGGTVTVPNTSGPMLALNVPSPAIANTCWGGVVSYLNNGVATNIPMDTVINMVGPSSITYYTDNKCLTQAVTQVTITANSSSAVVYMLMTSPGLWSITSAVASGSPAGSYTAQVTVNPLPPPAVPQQVVINGNGSVNAGSCSAYTATLETSNGIPAPFTSASSLALSGGTSQSMFYGDKFCGASGGGPATNSIAVPAGVSVVTFWYKPIIAGSAYIFGTAGSVSGSESVSVLALGPDHVTILANTPVNNNVCEPVSINIRDPYENSTSFPNAVSANVSTAGLGNFYSENTCNVLASTVAIAANATSNANGSLFYSAGTGGSDTLSATVSSITPGTLPITVIFVGPGAPAKLVFNLSQLPPPGNVTSAGNCYGPFTIDVVDRSGVVISPAPSVSINLTSNGQGKFSAESSCGEAPNMVAPVATLSTSPGTNFWYLDDRAEGLTLTAADAAKQLASGQDSLVFYAGAISQVVVIGQSPNQYSAGACVPFAVYYSDAFGNPITIQASAAPLVVTESGVPGNFFSAADTGCQSAPIAASTGSVSFPMAAGDSAKYFHFQVGKFYPSSPNGTMNAKGGVYSAVGFPFSINAGTPTNVVLISSPTPVIVGSCANPFEFELFDQFGNPTTTQVSTSFSVTVNSGSFFSTSDCSNPTGTAINTIIFPPGSGIQTVSYMPTGGTPIITPITVVVTCGGFPPLNFNFPVNPGGPASLVVNGGMLSGGTSLPALSPAASPFQAVVGQCLPLVVNLVDAFGNGVLNPAGSSPIVVAPSSTLTGNNFFYATSTACNNNVNSNTSANAVTSLTIPANAGSVSFWYRGTGDSNGAVSVSDSPAFGSSNGYYISLSSGAATSITLMAAAGQNPATAGVCAGPFTISALDQFLNPTAAPGLNLSVTGVGKSVLYPNPGCDQPATPLSGAPLVQPFGFASPYVNAQFYLKDFTEESLTLLATPSNSNIAPVSLVENVQAGAPNALLFQGATSVMSGQCSSPALTFQVVDQYGNPTTDPVNDRVFSVSQQAPPAGVDNLVIASTSCSGPVATSVTIPHTAPYPYISVPVYFTGNASYVHSVTFGQSSPVPANNALIAGTVQLTVTNPLGKITSFTINGTPQTSVTVNQTGTAVVTWVTTNLGSCSITPGNLGTSTGGGTVTLSGWTGPSVAKSYTYSLNCAGLNGGPGVNQPFIINVNAPIPVWVVSSFCENWGAPQVIVSATPPAAHQSCNLAFNDDCGPLKINNVGTYQPNYHGPDSNGWGWFGNERASTSLPADAAADHNIITQVLYGVCVGSHASGCDQWSCIQQSGADRGFYSCSGAPKVVGYQ